jgi:hypothetical protein
MPKKSPARSASAKTSKKRAAAATGGKIAPKQPVPSPGRRPPAKPPAKGPAKAPSRPAAAGTILAWEDDPLTVPSAAPVQRPVPDIASKTLPIAFDSKAPPPKIYQRGTPEFRFWASAEALRRAADFWSRVVPNGFAWHVGAALPVHLDVGEDLNAFYQRDDPVGLNFFHDTVNGVTYYSGESPDVACHEFGHAVLDGLRPELFDAAFIEVAAFHESFGDISAILSVLQMQSLRAALIAAVGSNIYRNSRVSRIAEQIGFAIRQRSPDAVDADSLRNAVNSFFYRDPQELPPSNPSTLLSSEPHSFSRVFTAAYLEVLAGIFLAQGAPGSEQQLLEATAIAGKLIVTAAVGAAVVPAFYSQVAAHVLSADAALYGKKYRDAIQSAFVRRGILSLESAASTATQTAAPATAHALAMTAAAAAAPPESPVMAISAAKYGFDKPLYLVTPGHAPQFAVAAAAPSAGSVEPASREVAAQSFLVDLLRRGRIDVGKHGDPDAVVAQPLRRKTHVLVEHEDGVKLARRYFDCGFDAQ